MSEVATQESTAARIFRLSRLPGDIVDRLEARIPKCRGNSFDSQARNQGLTHCAECCFGTGIDATCDEELAEAIDLMDAVAEIERLRRLVYAIAEADANGEPWTSDMVQRLGAALANGRPEAQQ